MIQRVLGSGELTAFAVLGLVVFVAVFVGIVVWVLTRHRRQVRDWSELPLDDRDDPPREPRRSRNDSDPPSSSTDA